MKLERAAATGAYRACGSIFAAEEAVCGLDRARVPLSSKSSATIAHIFIKLLRLTAILNSASGFRKTLERTLFFCAYDVKVSLECESGLDHLRQIAVREFRCSEIQS